MHYSVGQEVYGGHTIVNILEEESKYSIYIQKGDLVMPWKDFNKNMAVSIDMILSGNAKHIQLYYISVC